MAVDALPLQDRPRPASRDAEARFRPGAFGPSDFALLAGAAVSSLAVIWLAAQLVDVTNGGFAIAWYLLFLFMYWFSARRVDGPLLAGDRLMAAIMGSAAAAMIVPLLFIIWYVIRQAFSGGALTPHFFTQTQQFTGPLSAASSGGAAHAIVGTLEQVGLAILITVPLGILCAVFLNEVGGPLGRPVRILVDAMSGVPTIVAGLFVYAVWVSEFGFSGFAATLAISISMLPVIARTSEEVLRLVPDGLREASYALGVGEWRTAWGVVLPTARNGLVTAVILGVARAVGETAPLIMTAFGAYVMNANPFSGAQDSLPLYIFHQITQSSAANVQARAWAGCLVLLMLVLSLFTLARVIGSRGVSGRSAGR